MNKNFHQLELCSYLTECVVELCHKSRSDAHHLCYWWCGSTEGHLAQLAL